MIRSLLRTAHFSKICLAASVLSIASGTNAVAEDVLLIEEHWELRVGGPDTARSAPQVTMTMSPTGDVENDFFLVTLNHWSYPTFAAGGIQIQRWNDEDCYEVKSGENKALLDTDTEVITWTQRISLVDGKLKFEVVDGNSHSWGSFGVGNKLSLTHPTQLVRLNAYRPAVSLEQSGISYAGNRVSSLVLKRLRWQTIDGEFHELIAPIDIATDLDP